MARKAFKPNKAIAKRFKVTKTGKLKRHHAFTSHLMSARPAHKRRKLRMSAVLSETHARRLRKLIGVHITPGKIATARRRKAAALAAAQEQTPAPAAE